VIEAAPAAAWVFGATGRLGKTMVQSLDTLGIQSLAITRRILSNYLATGQLPVVPERLVLVDASIDYTDVRRHEVEKHALIAEVSKRCRIDLIASFSSGATDFDDALIDNPSYLEYKRVKLENLAFFRSFGARLFYPKIYTLIGPNSYSIKTTGWVNVLEQASSQDAVTIAHPREPRSWITEERIGELFRAFVSGSQREYLDAPTCGTFCLADIVAFCEARRGRTLSIVPGQATPWLAVPYVAPHSSDANAGACNLQATLESLSNGLAPT